MANPVLKFTPFVVTIHLVCPSWEERAQQEGGGEAPTPVHTDLTLAPAEKEAPVYPLHR